MKIRNNYHLPFLIREGILLFLILLLINSCELFLYFKIIRYKIYILFLGNQLIMIAMVKEHMEQVIRNNERKYWKNQPKTKRRLAQRNFNRRTYSTSAPFTNIINKYSENTWHHFIVNFSHLWD